MEAFIEAVTPDTREQLNAILDALRADREKSWQMQPDGVYIREDNGGETSSQEALYRYFSTRKVSLEEKAAASVPDSPTEVPESPRRSGVLGWLHRLIKSS